MRGAIISFLLIAAVLGARPASGQDANQQASLVGNWEGMLFIGGYFWRFMEAELGSQDSSVNAKIRLPQDAGYAVTSFEVAFPRIRFRLTRGASLMDFEGEVRSEAIVGIVVQGTSKGTFQLIRGVQPPTVRYEKYAGTYQQKKGEFFLIAPFDFGDGKERLAYMSTAAGHWGILLPTAANSFHFGPARFAPFPVDLRVRFQVDETDQAGALRWERKNGATGTARRAVLHTEEPAQFRNGDVKLSGTLIKPKRKGPHAAIVMVHSSGAQSRNGLAAYYRLLANLFATRGIAVLVYDKRGVGASSGDWQTASFDDLSDDVLAGVEFLKKRKDIDRKRIGLWGSSQGGWLAPLAASKSRGIAFLVLVGAPAVSLAQQEIDCKTYLLQSDGFSPEEIAEADTYMKLYFDFVRTDKGWDALYRAGRKALRKRWARYVDVPDAPHGPTLDWWQRNQFDPQDILPALTCPILTILGERDEDVDGRKNFALFQRLVTSPGSVHRLYASADHHLLVKPTQDGQDYPQLANDFPKDMLEWVAKHVEKEKGP